MGESVLGSIVNSGGALLAAAGWLVSSWALVILAIGLLLLALVVRRSTLRPEASEGETCGVEVLRDAMSQAAH